MVESNEESIQNSLSELEKNAFERKERLKNIRAKLSEDKLREQNTGGINENATQLLFRSYKPSGLDKPQINVTNEQMNAIEISVGDHLQVTMDTNVSEVLDLNTLAPRKMDWDLKRGVQEKLEKLEHRTQKAISKLIRQKLEAGNSELLVAAINQATISELQN